MTPWDVIQEALAHMRPKRDQQWLAGELGIEAQAVTNWKQRGVPAKRFRAIAGLLNLSVDQLEGVEPLPWSKEYVWPFSEALYQAVESLRPDQCDQLEAAMWLHLDDADESVAVDRSSLVRARPVKESTPATRAKRSD